MNSGAGVDIESLPVIGEDATVHDTPDLVEPGIEDEPLSPLQLQVQTEDDIVGQSAAIAYETSLKQLVKYLAFPITTCTWGDAEMNVACNASPPFDCQVKKRGTAYVIEWVRRFFFFCHVKYFHNNDFLTRFAFDSYL